MSAFLRRGALILVAMLIGSCAAAAEEQGHCPAATSGNSQKFFGQGDDFDKDKHVLARMSVDIKRDSKPVCILAFFDMRNPDYYKRLALKRVYWIRSTLIGEGVVEGTIAVELRPGSENDDLQSVQVILGR